MNPLMWSLIVQLFALLIRPLIEKAVADPDEQWDDWMMDLLDKIFDFKKDD